MCNLGEWQKCPVCLGTGVVSFPPNLPADIGGAASSTSAGPPFQCRVCAGRGILARPQMGAVIEPVYEASSDQCHYGHDCSCNVENCLCQRDDGEVEQAPECDYWGEIWEPTGC